MLVVGINGSPNKEGNTAFLLEQALSAAKGTGADTKLIHLADVLADLNKPYCDNCSPVCEGACSSNNSLGKVFNLICRCDGLLVGSPVYFGTVSAQLKAFWDKTRFLRKKKGFLNLVGGAISVGGARFGGQETTIRAIHDMMLVHGMIVVGDGHEDADCGHQGACAQRPAREDQNGIERAKILGRRVAQVASVTSSLRKQ